MNIAEQIYQLNLGTCNILRSIAYKLNLTLSQVQCLLTIPFDSINMTSLSRQLGIDNSTLTRNLLYNKYFNIFYDCIALYKKLLITNGSFTATNYEANGLITK